MIVHLEMYADQESDLRSVCSKLTHLVRKPIRLYFMYQKPLRSAYLHSQKRAASAHRGSWALRACVAVFLGCGVEAFLACAYENKEEELSIRGPLPSHVSAVSQTQNGQR